MVSTFHKFRETEQREGERMNLSELKGTWVFVYVKGKKETKTIVDTIHGKEKDHTPR